MIQTRAEDRAEEFRRNLRLINSFHSHLRLFADEDNLELLSTFSFDVFTNRQARQIFGTKRIATYNRLAQLVEWGILEKRVHAYRVSPYAQELTRSTALMFKGLLTGRVFAESASPFKEILALAKEGAEMKCTKGMIDRSGYSRYLTLISHLEKQLE